MKANRFPAPNPPPDVVLKSHREPFHAVWTGNKTHEIRFNDRAYRYAMLIRLREFNHTTENYTGRAIDIIITHLRFAEGEGVPFSAGLKPGFVAFDFVILDQYGISGHSVDPTDTTPFTP